MRYVSRSFIHAQTILYTDKNNKDRKDRPCIGSNNSNVPCNTRNRIIYSLSVRHGWLLTTFTVLCECVCVCVCSCVRVRACARARMRVCACAWAEARKNVIHVSILNVDFFSSLRRLGSYVKENLSFSYTCKMMKYKYWFDMFKDCTGLTLITAIHF